MASYSYGTCPPSLPSSTPFLAMDSSEVAIGKPSPRRELQLHGPRPTPLKVSKDSYKIKKAAQPQAQQQPVQQHRPPVIIYTVSPKVIHTKASEFMTLVQRLTGASSSSVSPTVSASPTGGALSPAARLATFEKAQRSDAAEPERGGLETWDQQESGGEAFEKSGSYPGILSPVPASLPLISPNFFSSPLDPNSISFLHNMSPMSQDNKNYAENTFLTSPNNFLSTPTLSSPAAYWDLFNQGF